MRLEACGEAVLFPLHQFRDAKLVQGGGGAHILVGGGGQKEGCVHVSNRITSRMYVVYTDFE